MYGFHDRLLTLRKALHTFLSIGEASSAIYRRWRWQSHIQNMQYGLILTEKEWEEEWEMILRLASTEPRSSSSSSSNSSSCNSNSAAASSTSKGSTSTSGGRRRSRLSVVAMSTTAFSGGGICAMGTDNTTALVRFFKDISSGNTYHTEIIVCYICACHETNLALFIYLFHVIFSFFTGNLLHQLYV